MFHQKSPRGCLWDQIVSMQVKSDVNAMNWKWQAVNITLPFVSDIQEVIGQQRD